MLHVLFLGLISRSEEIDRKDASLHRSIGFSYSIKEFCYPLTLSQKKVTNPELRIMRIALSVLSSIPELDGFTDWSHGLYEDLPLTLLDEGSC